MFPRDGFTLNQADDADGDTSNGIQVDPPVRVAYSPDTGVELTLTSDQGETATATVDDDGFARFSGFTVNGSPDGLPVVLTVTDGDVEDEIEIEVISEVPLRVCTITSPADNAVLGPLDDAAINNPGFQAAVEVECQGVDAGTDVVVSVEGAVAQTVALDANGDAQAVVTLPNTDVGNNSNEISIDVDANGEMLNDEVTVTVVEEGDACDITITDPLDGATIDAAATDADGAPGFQYAVAVETGDINCADEPVQVTVDGTDVFTDTLTGTGNGTVIVTLPDGALTLLAEVTGDAAGATDTVNVTVDTAAPVIMLTSPENGRVYGPGDDDDGDTTAGLTLSFAGTVTGASTADYALACDDGTSQTGSVPTDGSAFDIPLADIPFDPSQDCTVTVTAGDGVNTAMQTVSFSVATASLAIDLVSDEDNDGFLVAAEDDDLGTATDMDADLEIVATFDAGTWDAEVTVYDLGADLDDPADDTVVQGPATIAGLSSGAASTYRIIVPFGEATYEARVTVTDGTTTIGPSIARFTVDTNEPSFQIQTPAAGQTFNLAADASGTPGFQVSVALGAITGFSNGETIEIRDANTMANLGNCIVSLPNCTQNVTFAEGTHAIVAYGVDAAMNAYTTPPVTFTVDPTPPSASTVDIPLDADDNDWIDAAEGGEGAGAVSADVVFELADADDIVGSSLTLTSSQGGSAIATVQAGTPATVTFTGFSLAQGSHDLTLSGADAAGNGIIGTTTTTIQVDTVSPSITLNNLAGPFLVANDNDANPATPYLRTITAAVTGAEGQEATLYVDGVAVGTGFVSGGSVTFTDIELPEGNPTIYATVADVAGNTAQSPDYTPLVDTVPPTLTIDSPAPGGFGPSQPVTIAFEVSFTDLTGAEQVCIESDIETLANNCVAATASPVTITVDFTQEAPHTVTATAVDANGNPGTSAQGVYDIFTGFFTVTFLNPPANAGQRIVGVAQDEVPGGDAQVSVQVSVPNDTGSPPATATLLIDGVGVETVPVMSQAAAFSALTFTDGQTGNIEVTVDNGVRTGTTGEQTFSVDLSTPTVSWDNPASPASLNATDAPGGTFSADFTVGGCEGGTFEVDDGVGSLLSLDVETVAPGGSGSFTDSVSANEGDNQTLTATCTDLNLNVGTAAITATVDITAPATNALNLGGTPENLRRGIVTVTFTEPGDDANVGTATTTELFARDTAIVAGDYGAGDLVPIAFTPGGGATAQSVDSSGLLLGRVWYFGLWTYDDVGNESFSTASISLVTTQVTITDPGEAGWSYSASVQRGQVGGTAHEDLIVGAAQVFAFGTGGFEVILGGNATGDFVRTFVTPPAMVPCSDVGGMCAPADVGYAVHILPDLNDDGYNEVAAVGYDQSRYNNELILIYAGSPTGIGATDTPVAVLESPFFSETAYVTAGVGNADGDAGGLVDWAMGSTFDNKVYLYLNDGAFPADGATGTVADQVLVSPGDARVVRRVRDIDNDGDDEIAVCDGTNDTVYIVRGRSAAEWATIDTDLGNLPAGDVYDYSGLGYSQFCTDMGAGDLDGDGDDDLVVLSINGMRIIEQTSAGVFSATPVRWSNGQVAFPSYGSTVVLRDVNDDGIEDAIYMSQNNSNGGGGKLFVGQAGTIVTRTTATVGYPFANTGPVTLSGPNILGTIDATALVDVVAVENTGTGTITIRF